MLRINCSTNIIACSTSLSARANHGLKQKLKLGKAYFLGTRWGMKRRGRSFSVLSFELGNLLFVYSSTNTYSLGIFFDWSFSNTSMFVCGFTILQYCSNKEGCNTLPCFETCVLVITVMIKGVVKVCTETYRFVQF